MNILALWLSCNTESLLYYEKMINLKVVYFKRFIQWFSDIIETTTKNGVVPAAASNVKKTTLFKDHMVRFKII